MTYLFAAIGNLSPVVISVKAQFKLRVIRFGRQPSRIIANRVKSIIHAVVTFEEHPYFVRSENVGFVIVGGVCRCISASRMTVPLPAAPVSFGIVGVDIYKWFQYFRPKSRVFDDSVEPVV